MTPAPITVNRRHLYPPDIYWYLLISIALARILLMVLDKMYLRRCIFKSLRSTRHQALREGPPLTIKIDGSSRNAGRRTFKN